jgi:hypothetical protein
MLPSAVPCNRSGVGETYDTSLEVIDLVVEDLIMLVESHLQVDECID